MTESEHKKIATNLRCKITKARNAAKGHLSLAQKLDAQRYARSIEQQLHEHLLNFFELTK